MDLKKLGFRKEISIVGSETSNVSLSLHIYSETFLKILKKDKEYF